MFRPVSQLRSNNEVVALEEQALIRKNVALADFSTIHIISSSQRVF
jgi:hypothetical protein